ncbi:unnamed protein product [Amoebophrya sp. A120]|nr:unnamed protein product [Amoebophrya sp. A120]|eukprot:GSA120T00018363001.1
MAAASGPRSAFREMMLQQAQQTAKVQPMDGAPDAPPLVGFGSGAARPKQSYSGPSSMATPAAARVGGGSAASAVPRNGVRRVATGRAAAAPRSMDTMSEAPSSVAASQATRPKKMHAPGAIPRYLQKFKQEKEDELARQEAEANKIKIPDGYRLVGDKERILTLEWFATQLDEVSEQMRKLPIRIETASQKKREKELVDKKERLEDGVQMFSKEIVVIPEGSSPVCEMPEDTSEPGIVEPRFPEQHTQDTKDRLFGGYEETPVLQNTNYAQYLQAQDRIGHSVNAQQPQHMLDANQAEPPAYYRGPASTDHISHHGPQQQGGTFPRQQGVPAAPPQPPGSSSFYHGAGGSAMSHGTSSKETVSSGSEPGSYPMNYMTQDRGNGPPMSYPAPPSSRNFSQYVYPDFQNGQQPGAGADHAHQDLRAGYNSMPPSFAVPPTGQPMSLPHMDVEGSAVDPYSTGLPPMQYPGQDLLRAAPPARSEPHTGGGFLEHDEELRSYQQYPGSDNDPPVPAPGRAPEVMAEVEEQRVRVPPGGFSSLILY